MADEFCHVEHISVERFINVPAEAQNIELILKDDIQLVTDGEFIRHLLTHISNEYEGRIIKPKDYICFDFYGHSLSLQVFRIDIFPNGITEQLQNISLTDEKFFHISSSTSWSIQNTIVHNKIVYPISNVGGLSDVYEKVMNIVQKTQYRSKLLLNYVYYIKYILSDFVMLRCERSSFLWYFGYWKNIVSQHNCTLVKQIYC